jgi:hypothetical protein
MALAKTLLPVDDPRHDTDALMKEDARIHTERVRRLSLLAEELGIDPKGPEWRVQLLFLLAAERAPGLRISEGRDPRGRKRGGGIDAWKLKVAVDDLRKARNLTIAGACAQLAKRSEWKPHTRASLETAYHAGKREMIALRKLKREFS